MPKSNSNNHPIAGFDLSVIRCQANKIQSSCQVFGHVASPSVQFLRASRLMIGSGKWARLK